MSTMRWRKWRGGGGEDGGGGLVGAQRGHCQQCLMQTCQGKAHGTSTATKTAHTALKTKHAYRPSASEALFSL
jgi:hypothetical protein